MSSRRQRGANHPVDKVALNAIQHSAYGGRAYQQLSYMERRFGGCCYTKQKYDTDPLGSRTGDVGRLQTIPNISNQKHHVWNSKESDWWRDILRREGNAKKANMRVLGEIVRDSKIMYSMDRQPRTVLGTEPPTMTEASLRKMKIPLGQQMLEAFQEKNGTQRSQSRCEGEGWENSLLERHGLELSDDQQRLRLSRAQRPRVDEIEALHMSTMLPTDRVVNKKMKRYLDRESGESASMSRSKSSLA